MKIFQKMQTVQQLFRAYFINAQHAQQAHPRRPHLHTLRPNQVPGQDSQTGIRGHDETLEQETHQGLRTENDRVSDYKVH